jgi:hypothetical protein
LGLLVGKNGKYYLAKAIGENIYVAEPREEITSSNLTEILASGYQKGLPPEYNFDVPPKSPPKATAVSGGEASPVVTPAPPVPLTEEQIYTNYRNTWNREVEECRGSLKRPVSPAKLPQGVHSCEELIPLPTPFGHPPLREWCKEHGESSVCKGGG